MIDAKGGLNIHQRLHAAMGSVDYIQKDKKAGMNYTIVSHDAVTAKVRPVLHKNGIVYYPVKVQATQDGNRTQVHLTVRFANIDQPADFIDVESLGYGIDPQDKGPGKAISYAVKYALLKALGLETGDDPDTESVEHESAKAPTPPPTSADFALTHPDGSTDRFAKGSDFLAALESDMKRGRADAYWALNGKTALALAEKYPAKAKAVAERLQTMAQGKAA